MASDQGNWGYAILALTIAFLILVLIFLFLRIITRVWIVHQFWYDDAAIILAVVSAPQRYLPFCSLTAKQLGTTIGAGLDFVEVNYGFGKHQQFLSPHNLQEFRKYTYGEWVCIFRILLELSVRHVSGAQRPASVPETRLAESSTLRKQC